MISPRRERAFDSPRTHRMASTILLFPHPFGPTMAVTPGLNSSLVLSAKVLNPWMSMRLRNNTFSVYSEVSGKIVNSSLLQEQEFESNRGCVRSPAVLRACRIIIPVNNLIVRQCVDFNTHRFKFEPGKLLVLFYGNIMHP